MSPIDEVRIQKFKDDLISVAMNLLNHLEREVGEKYTNYEKAEMRNIRMIKNEIEKIEKQDQK